MNAEGFYTPAAVLLWSRKRRLRWVRRARKDNDLDREVLHAVMREVAKRSPFLRLLVGPWNPFF